MTSRGSRQEDFGLAPLEQTQDRVDAANARNRERIEAGMAPAAIDSAIAAGRITEGGVVLLGSGGIGGIRLGKRKPERPKGDK